MTRILTDVALRHRLKAATRDLVKLCGGVERVGELTSYSDTHVSRWQSVGEAAFAPLPAVVTLEADCGVLAVTTALAAIHGRQLTSPAQAGPPRETLMCKMADLMRDHAATQTAFAVAMADGVVTPAEAEIVERTLTSMSASMERMRNALAHVRATGADDLRAPVNDDRASGE